MNGDWVLYRVNQHWTRASIDEIVQINSIVEWTNTHPEHQWMKNPHIHSIMDEPPAPTCHSVNGWKNPILTPLWMKLQHYPPVHQWMKKPQTDYIMDELPASNHNSITSQKTPNWLHYGWTSIHPHNNYCMKKPNWVSSFMDEPPASTYQSTKLTMSRMNLQHRSHTNINGRKNPKLISFNDEPPSDHKRITRWRNRKRS